MRAHEHGRLPVPWLSLQIAFRLLVVIAFLACGGMISAFGQSGQTCQTLSLQLQNATGDGYVQFGFYIAPASSPTEPLFYDSVIQLYTSGPPQTFDLGAIINLDYGIFPAGPYVVTVFETTETPGTVNTGLVQLTLGSGLRFQGGSHSTTVSVSTSNPAGVTVPITNPSASCKNSYTPDPVEVLDPVSDLLDGSHITGDRGVLATGGREVQGIAADGVAQVVFRIPVQADGDVVTATLLSNCSDPSTPQTCSPSPYSGDDGGLFPVGTAVTAKDVLPNTLSDTATPPGSTTSAVVSHIRNAFASSGPNAFIAYRAPVDFVQYYHDDAVLNEASRMAYLRFSYASSDGTSYAEQYTPLPIVRPPVILIHGYASDAAETWSAFDLPSWFTSFTVNYGDYLNVKSTSPPLGGTNCESTGSCVTSIRQSDLGFTYNTFGGPTTPDPGVAQQVIKRVSAYATGSNPLQQPVASVQADVVAHSMGGLIARNWTTNKARYFDSLSLGQGHIHKLITLGTPHLGSPFATLALLPNSSCFRNNAARNVFTSTGVFPARLLFASARILGNRTVPGAVGELDGDGIGARMNPSLVNLEIQSSPLPTAPLAGDIGEPHGAESTAILYATHTACALTDDPLASRFTPSLFNTIFSYAFNPNQPDEPGAAAPNDGAVPLTSALWDPIAIASNCDNVHCFAGYAHGGNTQRLTGAPNFLVDGLQPLLGKVGDLLNTNVFDQETWVLR